MDPKERNERLKETKERGNWANRERGYRGATLCMLLPLSTVVLSLSVVIQTPPPPIT